MVRSRRLPFVPYIPRLREEKRRGRYITDDAAKRLREALPGYAAEVFGLALVLPNRRGQLSRTLRRFVDLGRGVIEWPAIECKADEPHTVPLVGEALALVKAAMERAVPWCPYLFHGPDCRPGQAPSKRYGCIGDFRKAWAEACRTAGLPVGRKAGGYVFHHTRNTAATNLRANGLSEGDCMVLGGWKTRAVFDWYNLGDVEALRERLAAANAGGRKVVPMRRAGGD
jgi:integrase